MNTTPQVAKRLLAEAKKAGADQAEVLMEVVRSSSVSVRDGAIEELSQSTSSGIGLRVFVKGRLGFVTTSDLRPETMGDVARRAVELAKVAARDPNNGLPAKATLASGKLAELHLFDPAVEQLSDEWKLEAARTMEKVARGVDRRITSFEGCGAADSVSDVFLLSSEGASGRHRGTYVSLWAAPVAQEKGELQVGHWSESRRYLSEMPSAESVAKRAAERAVRMLGARSVPTQNVPVIFDPQMAASFVGGLAAAVNGDAVFKRMSFLGDKLGKRIAPEGFTVIDDGLLPRGLASAPFDGEGVPHRAIPVIEGGVLKSFLYDTHTARKAKAKSTGSARRGHSSLPGVGTTNFFLGAGKQKPEELIRSVKKGLYVTSMLGRGANATTGDYSRGALGMWIENGELAFPVQACTVAGNMLGMLERIDGIGDDLVFRSSVCAPTLRFAELTVSGT